MTKTGPIRLSAIEQPPVKTNRAKGYLEVTVVGTTEGTRLKTLRQMSPCRVFFPSVPRADMMEAILVNTSGGLVEGDDISTKITTGEGARLRVESQAAEKIYRSLASTCMVSNEVRIDCGGLLLWLPQETIVFDGARLSRRLEMSVTRHSRLLAAEVVIFGRIARGERLTHGELRDSWLLRCDGKLLWMDCLRLKGEVAAQNARRFGFADSAGLATVLYFGDDAESLLPLARQNAAHSGGGATLINGVLLARFLNRDEAALREASTEFTRELARIVIRRYPHGTNESYLT
ncbi:MAG TPA: urease accessory protein UreD [Methylocella sp.]|nr:urease accessory protein UreD [Methylocella sp.]